MIDVKKALKHLANDKTLFDAIRYLEIPTFERKNSHARTPFHALAESIVYQQLAGKAAETIFNRVLALFPNKKLTPQHLLKLSDAQLRGAGLSGQKMSYMRDLAQKFLDGTIDEKNLHRWPDEKIREHLISVKGIGRWTADMFLIFYLHRPDVFPSGDLGIQKGFQKLYAMKKLPTARQMERVAATWSPWRTVASRYLWNLQDQKGEILLPEFF
ncbi:MAG TPA: DNA-3-methyladenine glycosylase, partial [Candidatus Paceibacterota bacterium]|nr:DNA-3-methyladenine glycosylase [Candidatus Paceibacterota bacterium]